MSRFSIVIPNFNSGPVLERCIQSLLAQDVPDLQIIVADAASTDESAAILRQYSARFSPLLSAPDGGQADGLNRGFAQATGDIYGWLCADDELLPGAMREVAALFEANPEADIVAGACRHVYADFSERVVYPPRDGWGPVTVRNDLNQPSVFWRAGLHRRVGPLDTTFRLAFDWDFWCRMHSAGARVLCTDRILSNYHFSASNKTSSAGVLHVEEQFRIIRKYGPFQGLLAYVYLGIYNHFDMHGCLDSPPVCSQGRLVAYRRTLRLLESLLGRKWISLYNWHFASRQQRKLEWWNG